MKFIDLINRWFRQYLDLFVIMFIDYKLIYSRSENDHMNHLRIIFLILKDQPLYAKSSKFEFGLMSIYFLGQIVSCKGIKVDPKKINAIKCWSRPLSLSNIRSYLDLTSYIRRFVKGFSLIDSPSTTLTQKKIKFIWFDICEKSFQELKDRFTSAPTLILH